MLSISQLSVSRGGVPVLGDVSLTVAAGAILALIGPNGAGKSTLLKAILGLLPSTGTVTVDGQECAVLDPRTRARLMAYVPQRSQLATGLTVRNVVAQGRFAHQGVLARLAPADAAAIDTALARCAASAFAERPFSQLSIGEQQRVLLARALATQAPVLLLDEPTAALDVGQALTWLALLRELAAQGKTLLVAVHDLDQVARLADQIVLLDQGRIRATGSPAEVLTTAHLAPVFGVEPVPAGALGFRASS